MDPRTKKSNETEKKTCGRILVQVCVQLHTDMCEIHSALWVSVYLGYVLKEKKAVES